MPKGPARFFVGSGLSFLRASVVPRLWLHSVTYQRAPLPRGRGWPVFVHGSLLGQESAQLELLLLQPRGASHRRAGAFRMEQRPHGRRVRRAREQPRHERRWPLSSSTRHVPGHRVKRPRACRTAELISARPHPPTTRAPARTRRRTTYQQARTPIRRGRRRTRRVADLLRARTSPRGPLSSSKASRTWSTGSTSHRYATPAAA